MILVSRVSSAMVKRESTWHALPDEQGEDGLALTERRWNEVSNLREARINDFVKRPAENFFVFGKFSEWGDLNTFSISHGSW